MAYYQLDPFGEYRADLRAAMIAWILAEAHRDRSKRPEPFKIEDFVLFREERPEQTKGPNIAAMRWMMEAIVIARGGKDLRDGNRSR